MGKLIDARAYFDLNSWLPEIHGKKRIEIIHEWIRFADSLCECDSPDLELNRCCDKGQKSQFHD